MPGIVEHDQSILRDAGSQDLGTADVNQSIVTAPNDQRRYGKAWQLIIERPLPHFVE